VAERGGFEPPVELPLLRFSRPVRSAAPASLRCDGCYNARIFGILIAPVSVIVFK
jgi:hypothetical protein